MTAIDDLATEVDALVASDHALAPVFAQVLSALNTAQSASGLSPADAATLASTTSLVKGVVSDLNTETSSGTAATTTPTPTPTPTAALPASVPAAPVADSTSPVAPAATDQKFKLPPTTTDPASTATAPSVPAPPAA